MSRQVLIIYDAENKPHDFSQYIKRSGFAWSRNDLDSEKTGRLKNMKLRRDKLGTKRKIPVEMFHMTREELAELDTLLSRSIYTATYLDLHGPQTRNFYTSTFIVTLDEAYEDSEQWSGATFDMIEE